MSIRASKKDFEYLKQILEARKMLHCIKPLLPESPPEPAIVPPEKPCVVVAIPVIQCTHKRFIPHPSVGKWERKYRHYLLQRC